MRLGRRVTVVTATSISLLLIAALLIVRLTRHGQVIGPTPTPTSPLSTSALPVGVPALRFQGSGLEGAGFQNVLAVDPSGSGVVLAGGDVSGFPRSTDWGNHWETANGGITSQSDLIVATIVFSDAVPGKV